MTYLLVGIAGAIIWDLIKWGLRRLYIGLSSE